MLTHGGAGWCCGGWRTTRRSEPALQPQGPGGKPRARTPTALGTDSAVRRRTNARLPGQGPRALGGVSRPRWRPGTATASTPSSPSGRTARGRGRRSPHRASHPSRRAAVRAGHPQPGTASHPHRRRPRLSPAAPRRALSPITRQSMRHRNLRLRGDPYGTGSRPAVAPPVGSVKRRTGAEVHDRESMPRTGGAHTGRGRGKSRYRINTPACSPISPISSDGTATSPSSAAEASSRWAGRMRTV